MIDTSSWKEFRVGDYFEIFHGVRLTKSKREEGDIPLLTAGYENQGVAEYINNPEMPRYRNSITVDMFGNCFYHDGVYTGDDNIYFFINDDISHHAKLFLSSMIMSILQSHYDYGRQFRQSDADALKVILPATPSGEPDWDYMESYMKKVMEETKEYIRIVGGHSFEKHPIDVSEWGKFSVSDFFKVLKGHNKLSNADIDDGDIPVYSSNSSNGGIFGYTTKEPDYIVDENIPFYIIFGDHTKAMNIADTSFCVMDNVKILTTEIRNYNILYFIMTSWMKNVPDLGYARHWNVAEKATIYLPITPSGEPDWQYMKDFMKGVMEDCERTIEAMQKVITK